MLRLAGLLVLVVTWGARAAPGPNIVFILADDLGRDWLSCYGSSHATPNLDRLAESGVRFNTCWATPLCTPTRMMLLTGQYPWRSGWIAHHDVPRWGGVGFDPDKFTCIARVLKQAGYATAIAGKWQINDLRADGEIMRRHGFDEHCLWTGVEKGNKASDRRYWDAFLQTNGERKTHAGGFGPDITQAFVMDFIARNKERPFFVYYPMIAVHAPNEPTPLNKGNAPRGEAALYAGMVTYMDHQVGQLMKYLDDLKVAEKTIIVFAGDNGSSTPGTLNQRKMPAGKAKTTDLGVHVPLIVRAPMLARQGRVSEALIDFTDFFPTLCEAAGAPPPGKLDGQSFVAVLKDAAQDTRHREWIFSQLGANRTVRDRRWKLDSDGSFYDIAQDPVQATDLSHNYEPEILAARQRLGIVLQSMPADAKRPFEPFGKAGK